MSSKYACPNPCNVLLVGGGGREHALAWKMKQSENLGTLYATNWENGGISTIAERCDEQWDPARAFFMSRWCDAHDIHLVVVGPEIPLADGIVDELTTKDRLVFGPCKEAAKIEADKSFAKDLMRQACIPTADSRTFTDINSAKRYLLRGLDLEFESEEKVEWAAEISNYMNRVGASGHETPSEFSASKESNWLGGNTANQDTPQGVFSIELQQALDKRVDPCVVKASGLAAGKGVIVCNTVGESLSAIDVMMKDKMFGDAGGKILIEEFMSGQEVSVLALVDGATIWVLDLCQDHKQVGDGDLGPNTGGMGAFCPAPLLDEEMLNYVEKEILVPAIDAMRRNGVIYQGVLYAGLMLTPGGPKVVEFNCRFGDPETQPLLARFQGDLVDVLWRTAAGKLDGAAISFDDNVACCVVMCSEGYPGNYERGKLITGFDEVSSQNLVVFHAGTTVIANESETCIKTSGGRVLGVTAIADDLKTAQALANNACSKICFEGAFWRTDIGHRVAEVKEIKRDGSLCEM